MSKNTLFIVGDHFSGFIETQVVRAATATPATLCAGLRLLEEQEAKLAALRAALIEGEESGVSHRSVHDMWKAVKNRDDAARG